MSEPGEAGDWTLDLAEDDLLAADFGSDPHSLLDLVNRLLDKGVVISGDITISVAGVDLVYLGLNAVLTSVQTAKERLGRQVGTALPDR